MSDSSQTSPNSSGSSSGTVASSSADTDGTPAVDATVIPQATQPASSGSTLLAAGTTLGPYRIETKLGEGGMGAVYKAVHTKLDKTVAIKVLPAHLVQQADSVARFEREMRAVGKLDHPHIVRAMDAGEINGTHYLAMEYVEGSDLARLVKDRGPFSITNACKAVRQAALALSAAHRAGLIHRDIKPQNLLVGKNGQVKLLDLGLARLGDDAGQMTELTSAGQTFGTPDFMAPEQWSDAHAVDARTDLYALGCTLFYLLVGRTPYGTDNYRTAANKMKGHVIDPIPDLRAARVDVPEGLAAIYMRLMAKNPADRYQQAAELAEALAPYASTKSPARAVDETAVTSPPASSSSTVELSLPPSSVGPTRALATAPSGSGGRVRTGNLLALAAGGAAAMVLLGVIIITLTNPDGTKTTIRVAEGSQTELGKLPPGTTVKISQEGDEGAKTGDPSPGGPAPVEKEAVPSPMEEPPPLEDWLKGRTVLTVAQDGSGQFKTIQAALNALKAGQVVKVLDRGPYRESLRAALPADTGLISEARTVLQADEWPAQEHAHQLSPQFGFRLDGLRIQARPRDGWFHVLHISEGGGAVVENCSFGLENSDRTRNCLGLAFHFRTDSPTRPPIWVRNCLLERTLGISPEPDHRAAAPNMVIEKNFFRDASVSPYNVELQRLILRHNVFDTPQTQALMSIGVTGVRDSLEIYNNTVAQSGVEANRGFAFYEVAPPPNVINRNNITDSSVICDWLTEEVRSRLADSWRSDHNNYLREHPKTFRSATDVVGLAGFLSTDPQHVDAWRISASSPLAKAGSGESLPNYIGALTPGPAPKTGDWFTKLRERWGDLKAETPAAPQEMTGPIKIEEPPPLDEWLKGRKILTVSQDGKGQFTTIQAALNALQSGQVVKVLDRGPYQERLNLQSPPDDIGLISEVQTRIEFAEFTPVVDSLVQAKGHYIVNANRLRINGFEFQIPPVPADRSILGIEVSGSRAVVFENCAVRRKSSPASSSLTFGWIRGGLDEPTVIRDCYLEQGVQVYSLPPLLDSDPSPGTALVTRNYITGEGAGLMAGDVFQHCVIRNNVFAGDLQFPLLHYVVHADWFELSNNTFLPISPPVVVHSLGAWILHERSLNDRQGKKNPQPVPDRGHAPSGQGAIYNNLHSRPGFLNVTGGAEDEPWTCQIGHNCYPGDGDIPARNALPRETNIIATPVFYSVVASDRDFARLQPDSPGSTSQAGVNWPNYTGALPPGPAPADGDWFTRLRERWEDLKPAGAAVERNGGATSKELPSANE